MKRQIALLLVLAAPVMAGERRAKNVILFIGDAAGIPTISAASLHEYGGPQKLFLQNMPHAGLMDTSAASNWVTDSAAGMTAIVTGYKTHNGVISQSDSAVRGKTDGAVLKTILEYAEERGLSTGVVSNSSIASGTPAACYAHVNDRKRVGEIFAQVLKLPYGDGVDVMIGPGRKEILEATGRLGLDLEAEMKQKDLPLFTSVSSIPAGARRAVVLLDRGDFDLGEATRRAIDILSRNPKGFFLMVESDCHTSNIPRGLERVIGLDRIIRQTGGRSGAGDTLIVFSADHSYDFRVHDGRRGAPLISEADLPAIQGDGDSIRLKNVRRDGDHTGEEVLVTAQGPGAGRVRGLFANTDLFHIMMAAYGWKASGRKGK